VAALQLVLPSDLIPEQVASLGRIPRNLIFYRDILAEHIGLHDTRTSPLDYLGSRDIALALLTIFVVLACLGLLIRIVTAFEEDASLIFYLLGAMVMIGRLSSRDGRYLFSMTPVIAYFAYQGIAATLNATLEPEQSRSKWVKRAPTAVAVAFLMLFVAANSTDLYRRTVRRLAEPAGQVQYGPESAKPQEMIDAVMRYTRRDEIVAFSRARLLNLYTERQSLQLTRVEHILERADWYMMRKDSFYSQSLISPEEAAEVGLTLVWENEIYVLWKVPPRY
jgi:hypothetical protein